ncbi:aminotransferase class III-fold pyridoxal phosphate-dependent enzyme [Achromobacter sp. GG226]|uniref:aspartate aminotransferase family protein n=1 Tax=Verticiella alkaliphila TaxID=2779529 RepID=UPI001C0D1E8F|nr:aminotransferase class III-fold pyridoxal phosphate-dependent enzyme [Verticiella sp. GG226]MBU4610783.1 aminotransferase class III-fold pyridoxal phosphate-dependent enzyme [Verticiella sp. GG226]
MTDVTAAPSRHADLDAALAASVEAFANANPASRAAFEQNARHMPAANSRSVLFYPPFPLTIVRGEGARVWDADGHAYIDVIAEYTAGVYGHSPEPIQAAVTAAMRNGISLTGHNPYEGRLAALLCERFAQLELVRFTNSGTEANLMAVTAARHFTGRNRIVVFAGAYHGGVLGFGDAPLPTTVPFDFIVLPYNDPDAVSAAFVEHGDQIAAVLVEPMMGAGGCIPGTAAFLTRVREASLAAGALLIVDEVMTSRLAPHGLAALHGIRPDLTTLGKYLGGGMPFGAFGGRREIMALFDPRTGPLAHSGTFNNNVVTMAAGHAGLTELFPPEAAARLSARGEALRARLNARCTSLGVPLQFTGVGSVMNAHPVAGDIARPADLLTCDPRVRQLLFLWLIAQGIYTAPRGLMVLSLPLSDEDIERLVETIEGFVQTYGALLGRRDG